MKKTLIIILILLVTFIGPMVLALDNNYLIVDLSGGSTASVYPVTTFELAPSDLLTNDVYKTTKLVLRRIPAGTYLMGSPTNEPGRRLNSPTDTGETQHQVTISKDFYIGIFKITQKQYLQVMGSNPSKLIYTGEKKPVTNVSWDSARGGSWPETSWPGNPQSSSFAGKLSARTGIKFDLPTEGLWEYSCRAGATKGLNNNTDYVGDESEWYTVNYPNTNVCVGSYTTITNVGTKLPNSWGLYDFHCNGPEWVLDYTSTYAHPETTTSVTDPLGFTYAEITSMYSAESRTLHATRNDITQGLGGMRCADNLFDVMEGRWYSKDYLYGPSFRIASTNLTPTQCGQSPQNSTWNDNGHDGATYQKPTPTTAYNTTPGDCKWVCKTNYIPTPSSNPTSCIAATNIKKCGGTFPAHAEMNDGTADGNFVQTWNGTIFSPVDKNFHHNNTTEECAWNCMNGYGYLNDTCITNQQIVSCSGTIPIGSEWNDNGQNGKFTQQESNEIWLPTIASQVVEYNEDANNCKWKCDENHYIDSTKTMCLEKYRKITQCNLTDTSNQLPENSKWNDFDTNTQNDGLFTQTYINGSWSPSTLKAFYSENPNECAYKCLFLSTQCQPQPEIYCGVGIKDCNQGYWGICQPNEDTMICSKNQFCDSNIQQCQFCSNGYKNCDMNLLNGCEKNVSNDANNCGACENVCAPGILCTNGTCEGEAPIDNCAEITCKENMSCNPDNGNCECIIGKYNCDNNSENGCESSSSCQVIQPPIDPQPPQPSIECTLDTECNEDKKCENNLCVQISCETNFTIENRICICRLNECGGGCFDGNGVCCKNNWNPKMESCEYQIDEIIDLINKSGNKDAIEMMQRANQSITEGKVSKGEIEAMLAELRAKIDIAGDSKAMLEKYDEAKTALNEGNYEKAKLIIEETTSALGDINQTNLTIPIILAIILILVIIFAINMIKKKPETNFNLPN